MYDPLIRLRAERLQEIHVAHLHSEQDDGAEPAGMRVQETSGYTEWATPEHLPALSFGWDWTYDRRSRRLQAHWTSLRTNLRVVDVAGDDLGDECIRLCVARIMTRACWERVVAQSLGLALVMPPDSRH
ncbi:DUF4902 domain-containing protein [Pseudorhodoferax sp.]|uniref:DUF4902 domain-containing protein n=1 Tax=Pseudorhodoferax sp. TaxID=1993553 RepID=UPI002DD67FC8|nr:DUF4902 domain-containing protein [Pseudorhodoferax sp.]